MKKLVFGVLIILLLIGIGGCASNSGATPAAITRPGTSSLEYSTKGGAQVTAALLPTTTTKVMTDTSTGVHSALIPAERMVIRSANLALVVEDVIASLQQITSLANANGGYVVNSDIQENQNRLYASINFRVQSGKFNDIIQALQNMAVDVRSVSTSGQDVTEEYVDLDAQLRNLEASESQLLALMDKAGTVKDILDVQQQLTNTRGQIEQIKGRMQYLQQSSDLSSIYVTLEQSKLVAEFSASATTVKDGDDIQFRPMVSGGFEPYSYEWNFGDGKTSTEASPVHDFKAGMYTVKLTVKDDKGNTTDVTREKYVTVLTGWDAGNVASSAWNGLVGFGRFLLSLVIWLGILSPIWIIVLVILYFTVWRKRKKKKS